MTDVYLVYTNIMSENVMDDSYWFIKLDMSNLSVLHNILLQYISN